MMQHEHNIFQTILSSFDVQEKKDEAEQITAIQGISIPDLTKFSIQANYNEEWLANAFSILYTVVNCLCIGKQIVETGELSMEMLDRAEKETNEIFSRATVKNDEINKEESEKVRELIRVSAKPLPTGFYSVPDNADFVFDGEGKVSPVIVVH